MAHGNKKDSHKSLYDTDLLNEVDDMVMLASIKNGLRKPYSFLKDVYSELTRVRWPKRQELISYTIVVLSTVSLIALFFALVDLGISRVIELILG